MAKIKVSETEFSKQTCDLQQIEAYKVYEQRAKQLDGTEKSLKRFIEKSTKYYEMKAFFNKELHFYLAKIEGLKSCLKEAKFAYQQSLKNLEQISSEVHAQRKTNANNINPVILNQSEQEDTKTKFKIKPMSPDTSSSNLSSSLLFGTSKSSPNLTNLKQETILEQVKPIECLTSTNKSNSLSSIYNQQSTLTTTENNFKVIY
jgi:hypothetical protein